ncbi:alpha/beta hydrolase [Companilactobacillus mishanensis]|uniref:Alpha/beta hydrolase n=1 Tax=Companilactobacillus mishanensis TaxID=2486008 RepID=A0A5P0ZKM8_9LACO|nr:alpha/beta hydrolase [Companilactobacillus mishanensis]MQS53227.1 alpha/beta hydrolase [Companilactobacillus mishanensis]
MKNKKNFKNRYYTSLAVLFLAGTIMTPAGNAYAATVDANQTAGDDKTEQAIAEVKKTGTVTLKGTDRVDLKALIDATDPDKVADTETTSPEESNTTTTTEEANVTGEAVTETNSDENTSTAATTEDVTTAEKPVTVDPDTTTDETATDNDSENTAEQPTDTNTDTDTKTDTDTDTSETTTADTTVPDVINKAGITASADDDLTMADIDSASGKTYKTLLGKIAGFIDDKVTDVTTGIAAALGYPLLFSRFGTQALSDFRTLLDPSRYDVSNTWTDLDEQYDPTTSQAYYTAAADWWNNTAAKEDVSVPYYNNANKQIRATYVAHPDSKKTVIIGQGWTERPDWIGVVSKVWYDMGYNVLMPSQRGQFASDGNLLSFGYYDKTDWKSLVNKVNEMNGDDGEIVFYGQSLGANTALEAASEDGLAPNVKAVVADAGYSTLPALGASLYNKTLASANSSLGKLIIPIHFDNIPFLPYDKIMKHVDNINKFFQGFGLDDVSGIVAAAKTTLPAYFISTEDDAFIPNSQSAAMYDANNSAIKKLWILDGNVGGHASANNAVTEYQSNIQAFIDEVNKANNLKVNVEVTDAADKAAVSENVA